MEPKKMFDAGGSVATGDDWEVPSTRNMGVRTAARSLSIRRRSRSSLHSELSSSGPSVSCASRATAGENCARQKFIVWAAVKRNKSVRMAASERLKCPLLQCRQEFRDHEAMLQHLTDCRHFSSGEYFCYECIKVERFTDDRCKCCLGHPTKRRRMINMAKNFFSTLGHKSRKEMNFEFPPEEFAMPPPSYESLDMQHQQIQQQEQEQELPLLEGTEILEMDAGSIPAVELDSVNYETLPTDVCEPSGIPPLPFMEEPINFFNYSSEPRLNVQQSTGPVGNKPMLALDTHNIERRAKVPRTTYLSPSSSLRSTNSSQISPISSSSGQWTMASSIGTALTSPITPFSSSEAGSTSLSRENSCKFPKDFPLNFPGGSNWSCLNEGVNTVSGSMPSQNENENNYTPNAVSELPGDDPVSLAMPRTWGEDPFLFSFSPKDNYSWSSSIDTEVHMLFTSDNMGASDATSEVQQETTNCEPKALAGSTRDALQEHILSSFEKISHLNNPVAKRLKSLSAKDIALKGLSSLRGILNGIDPTDPVDYLCFIHLVYAFSLVIHEDELASRCNRLFKQALAYRGFLNDGASSSYSDVVTAIWQPTQEQGSTQTSSDMLSRSSSLKGKEPEVRAGPGVPIRADALVAVAQNFLDGELSEPNPLIMIWKIMPSFLDERSDLKKDLEMSVLCSSPQRPIEVLMSGIWSTHFAELQPNTTNEAFTITSNYIIQVLSQKFNDSDVLSLKLKSINQRVADGSIPTTRKLELGLLQAGKNSMLSSELFDEFIPQVRGLCDPMYAQQGFNPRTKYHVLGIDLLESLLDFGQKQEDLPSFPEPDLDEFLENLDNIVGDEHDFSLSLDTSMDTPMEGAAVSMTEMTAEVATVPTNLQVPPVSVMAAHSTVDPTSLSRISSSTHPPRTTTAASTSQAEDKARIPIPKDKSASRIGDQDEDEDVDAACAAPEAARSAAASQKAVDANSQCKLCGYRPRGDPQWFKGSMAKHKKLQHSTEPPRIYRCPFPGCTSAYKNRPDNLRQHQIEKGHFINGVDEKGRRPQKRKKMDV